jgi:hypothetical protein
MLRTPFFIAALVLSLLIVLLEIGSLGALRGIVPETATPGGGSPCANLLPSGGDLGQIISLPDDVDLAGECEGLDSNELGSLLARPKPPGMAVSYLALLDGILLFTVGLMGVGLIVRERLQGRIQGCATLIFSLLLLLGAIGLVIAAFLLVILMVSLLLAAPFGTLTYLAVYGFFNRSGASAALGLLMMLKLGFLGCLIAAQQRFLQNRGLMLMVLTSLLSNVIVAFLHGLVPGFLVSITDGIAAVVVAILAIIWAIVLLIGAIPAVIRAIGLDRA